MKLLRSFAGLLAVLALPAMAEDFTGTVLKDKAVIYGDPELTTPIGFMRGGKKITVAPNAKNDKALNVLVPNKKAYIKKRDVVLAGEAIVPALPTSERFARATYERYETKYVTSLYSYGSTLTFNGNGTASEGEESVSWLGLSLKGEAMVRRNWDVQVLANFMQGSVDEAKFRTAEFGLGGAYRVVQREKFFARIEAHFLTIPFAKFIAGDYISKNIYGLTVGSGVTATYMFKQNWGVEGSLGWYYTRILRIELPEPFGSISPTFAGTRIGLGVNYQY